MCFDTGAACLNVCVELVLHMVISSVSLFFPLDYHQQTEEEQWSNDKDWRRSLKGIGRGWGKYCVHKL